MRAREAASSSATRFVARRPLNDCYDPFPGHFLPLAAYAPVCFERQGVSLGQTNGSKSRRVSRTGGLSDKNSESPAGRAAPRKH